MHTGPSWYLAFCIALMPVNMLLEAYKWQVLASSAQPLTFKEAMTSYIAGIAFSIVTPNRIGEYPGRILYLKRKNTLRLASVSVLGAVAQMLTLFIYGVLGLAYYYAKFGTDIAFTVLILCVAATAVVGIIYWRYDLWLPLIERIKWLRRYNVYGKMLRQFTVKEQLTILFISILRYAIYTAQYLILLRWMNVYMPIFDGFCMSALFFWVMAVVPSIALMEIGARGQIGLYLFHHFSSNTIGILGATFGIWCINLALPAIIGSVLLFRTRLVR